MTGQEGILFARFGIDKERLSANRVYPKLFQPDKYGALSVLACDGLEESQIEDAGKRTARKRRLPLFGWAMLTRAFIQDIAKLTVTIDNTPYCRHATISGWAEDRNIRRATQQQLAVESSKQKHVLVEPYIPPP